jgi:thiol-disulfide isomerase/thioredoxin
MVPDFSAHSVREVILGMILAFLLLSSFAMAKEFSWIGRTAPEIAPGVWFNSQPLHMKELRGKVVLVEFWTFACVNCRNTISHIRAWRSKYPGDRFEVVGVHTPELIWEHNVSALRSQLNSLKITWPVVTDNEYRTWNAYHQQYWPVLYLVDKTGVVRSMHIGEGEYDETEKMIEALLEEP